MNYSSVMELYIIDDSDITVDAILESSTNLKSNVAAAWAMLKRTIVALIQKIKDWIVKKLCPNAQVHSEGCREFEKLLNTIGGLGTQMSEDTTKLDKVYADMQEIHKKIETIMDADHTAKAYRSAPIGSELKSRFNTIVSLLETIKSSYSTQPDTALCNKYVSKLSSMVSMITISYNRILYTNHNMKNTTTSKKGGTKSVEQMVNDAIDQNDHIALYSFLCTEIKMDPRFESNRFNDIITLIKQRGVKIEVPYVRGQDEFELPPEKWTKRYFYGMTEWLRNNFAPQKRLPLIKAVGRAVFEPLTDSDFK